MSNNIKKTMLQVARDFALGLIVFTLVVGASMADTMALNLSAAIAPQTAAYTEFSSVMPLGALAVLFSTMLAFGLWFYRQASPSRRRYRYNG